MDRIPSGLGQTREELWLVRIEKRLIDSLHSFHLPLSCFSRNHGTGSRLFDVDSKMMETSYCPLGLCKLLGETDSDTDHSSSAGSEYCRECGASGVCQLDLLTIVFHIVPLLYRGGLVPDPLHIRSNSRATRSLENG